MEPEENGANSYQSVLRSIGSYLDEEPSCRISVVEVPDGFLVRMQRSLHKLEPHVEYFKRDTLAQHVDQFTRTNQTVGTRQYHQGVWSHFPNGHQDFMRALGYELDDAKARHIVLDELEEGVNLTYTAPSGAGWETRVHFLSIDDVETILNEAFNRRHRSGTAPSEKTSPGV